MNNKENNTNWLDSAENIYFSAKKIEEDRIKQIEDQKINAEKAADDYLKSHVDFIYPQLKSISSTLLNRGYEVNRCGYSLDFYVPSQLRSPTTTKGYWRITGSDSCDQNEWTPNYTNLVFQTGGNRGEMDFCSLKIGVGIDNNNNYRLGLKLCLRDDPIKIEKDKWGRRSAVPSVYEYLDPDKLI